MISLFSTHWRQQLSLLFWVICVMTSLFFLGFSWNRGLTLHDEGTVIMGGWRAWEGETPYRDFHYFYPPLTIGLTMASFQLFGVSVLAERALAALFALTTMAVVFSITRHFKLPLWMSGLAILAYTVWGPATYNFLWPTIVALNFSLWALRFSLKKQFVASGFIVGLAVLTKQNIGVAVGVALLLAFIVNRGRLSSITRYIGGGLLVGLGFLIWLISTGALIPFYEVMMYYMAEVRIGTQGWYIAFLNFGSPLKQLFKSIVYVLPLAIPIMALLRSTKDQKILALMAFLMTLSNIYPLWDLVHISAFFSLMCLAFLTMTARFSFTFQLISGVLVLALCAAGVWSTFLRGYYRWEAPLVKSNTIIDLKRGGILVDERTAEKIASLKSQVGDLTTPDKYVLVYHFAPMINFLLERRSPSFMIDMTQNMVSNDNQRRVVSDLEKKKPPFMIAQREPENWGNPILARYFLDNYSLLSTADDLFIWKRL